MSITGIVLQFEICESGGADGERYLGVARVFTSTFADRNAIPFARSFGSTIDDRLERRTSKPPSRGITAKQPSVSVSRYRSHTIVIGATVDRERSVRPCRSGTGGCSSMADAVTVRPATRRRLLERILRPLRRTERIRLEGQGLETDSRADSTTSRSRKRVASMDRRAFGLDRRFHRGPTASITAAPPKSVPRVVAARVRSSGPSDGRIHSPSFTTGSGIPVTHIGCSSECRATISVSPVRPADLHG